MAHVNLLKQTLARNCRVLRDDCGDWHWNLYGPRFVRAGRRLERKANAAQTSGGRKKISLPRTRRSELRGLRFSLRFRLLAHLGEAPRLPAFINSMGGVWSYGASLAQPILAGGGLQSNLRLAESQERQAQLSYRQTIQKAFGDVSDALIDYQKYHEARLKQEEYVGDLQESVRLANMRYYGGITTYLEVLDQQRSLFTQQLTLAQFRGFEYQSLVQLYRALGGGWQR